VLESQQAPEFLLTQAELEAHIRFLAADELMGRRTGSEGNNLAARYLATQMESWGVQQVPGAEGYYQPVRFLETVPAASAEIVLNKQTYQLKDDFLMLRGDAITLKKAKAVFVGYGTEEDLAGKDLMGKVVIALSGGPGITSGRDMMDASGSKQERVKAAGAVALIELYNGPIPWRYLVGFLGRKQLNLAADDAKIEGSLPHFYLNDKKPSISEAFAKGKEGKISLRASGVKAEFLPSQNVIGWIEGSDPELKKEYVIITAHYDHVGTGEDGGQKFTPEDSIFNGARDNAIGVTSLLAAAKCLSIQRPKRSVVLLAVTGEELGLLGSRYYVNHPLIPLEKTVFNLNTDGGGYTNTSAVGIMGYHRVGAQAEFDSSATAFGFTVIADPAPEQNLFDRSDNVSFAAKGIPAPSYGLGFDDFDAEIMKYYHQVADEADNLDFAYLHRAIQAFAHCARLVADKAERPFWKEGDKYEEVGKELYGLP
ncbi:MAG: M28 family peptidase, partial [Bacteroidota bacterium]